MRRKNRQIKKLRLKVIEDKKNGLTYKDIRKKRGVSPSTISQWTKGKDLKRYCKLCGETDPEKLEEHHPNKQRLPNHTETLCASCHSKITREQFRRKRKEKKVVQASPPEALFQKSSSQSMLPQFNRDKQNPLEFLGKDFLTPEQAAQLARWLLFDIGGNLAGEAFSASDLHWIERLGLLILAGYAFWAGFDMNK